MLGFVEPHPSEAELYERLARIGIGAGRGWRPEDVPPKIPAAIDDGAKQGLADIDGQASRTTSSIGIFGSREQLGDDYLTRAVAAQMGIYGQVAEEAVYGGSRLDANGDQLVGDRTYSLRFDKDALPEAKFFWSLTLYRLPVACSPPTRSTATRSAIELPASPTPRTVRSKSRSSRPKPTDPLRRANWLPTPAGEPFTIIYRLYGPGEKAQAGTWSLPAITQDS